MSDRLLHGEPVSDEQIQARVDEVERGYDLIKLAPPRPVSPPVGKRTDVAATVHLDVQTLRGAHGTHYPQGDRESC